MKKSILSILAVASIFVGCSSDDDSTSVGGGSTFTLDESSFKGTIESGTITLDSSKEYSLTGAIVVENGATLTIPAGTVITASGGTNAYIAVAQGGKINVNGTKDNPVVMTSTVKEPGKWGGLVICGKANTNKGGSDGETASAEVSDLTYGGTIDNDNSGSIKYLRLEYTGAEFTEDKQFNGLSLFGVGSGTTIEYVQAYKGKDDGVEFFGGSVSAKYLVSTEAGDDGIDFADGWKGTGEYWYVKDAAKAGIEGSNNGDDFAATPTTTATVSKISIVNAGTAKDEGALYMKEGAGKWTMTDVYVKGGKSGFFMKSADVTTAKHISDNDQSITNIQFDGISGEKVNGNDSTSFFSEADNTGAGAGETLPTWAAGWTK